MDYFRSRSQAILLKWKPNLVWYPTLQIKNQYLKDIYCDFLWAQVWPLLLFGLPTSACVAARLKRALCNEENCAAGKATLIEL